MTQLVVAKTVNRSVLGTMNDIVDHCRWHAINRSTLDLRRLELELAGMPAQTLEFGLPESRPLRCSVPPNMRLKLTAPVLECRIAFVNRIVWRRSLGAIR